jgi:multisubunit Na+/H+ antiporter MnhF subunit
MFNQALLVFITLLSLSLVAATVRLMSGPGVPDRIVALQVVMMHSVGLIALYALLTGQRSILDYAIIVAVAEFISTVALARYIEKGGQ